MKYRCLLCKEFVGSTIKEKNQHLKIHHLKELAKLGLKFEKARLLYFEAVTTQFKEQLPQEQEDIKLKRVYGMSPKKVRKLLMGIRGKKVEGIHVCSCCKTITEHTWNYMLDGYRPIYICNNCHLIVKAIHCHCNVIYNSVETNRRKH